MVINYFFKVMDPCLSNVVHFVPFCPILSILSNVVQCCPMLSHFVQFCQTKCFRILHFGYCSHLTNESLTPVARKDKCEDDFILLQQKAAAQGTGCPKPHLMKMESKSAGHTSASHHYHSVWKSPQKSHSKLSLHLRWTKMVQFGKCLQSWKWHSNSVTCVTL